MDKPLSQTVSRRYRILIVDDELMVRKCIGEMLNLINFTVYYADKGDQALEIIKKEDIDLIILDILLPDMDGFRVATYIRTMDHYKDTPIIMISGIYKKMKYKYYAKELGINTFLLKPFKRDIIIKEINKLLNIEAV